MQDKRKELKGSHGLFWVLICLILVCVWLPVSAENMLSVTNTCTNYENEGIKYHFATRMSPSEVDKWRYPFTITSSIGSVIAVEMSVASDWTRYQCTEQTSDSSYEFTCNSLPTGAVVTDIYFSLVPSPGAPASSGFQIEVNSNVYDDSLFAAWGTLTYPPYPCAINDNSQTWNPAPDSAITVNTNPSCVAGNSANNTPDSTVRFLENPGYEFAVVNQVPSDTLSTDRFKLTMDGLPRAYSFLVTLNFSDKTGSYPCVSADGSDCRQLVYRYNEGDSGFLLESAGAVDGMSNSDLPLKLAFGTFSEFKTSKYDLWGNPSYPQSADFKFRFYYENDLGTQGYENSDYHFERSIKLRFAPFCQLVDNLTEVPYVTASNLYDPCGASRQSFTVSFLDSNGNYLPVGDDYTVPCIAPTCNNPNVGMVHDDVPKDTEQHIVVRKCSDASCVTFEETGAFVRSVTVMDGDNISKTYKPAAVRKGTYSSYMMKLYDRPSAYPARPFQIKSVSLEAGGPGTYEISFFTNGKNSREEWAARAYVTIGMTDSQLTCVAEGTNGYYVSKWNDCLDPNKTQLMTMVPEREDSRGLFQNKSNKDIRFYYNHELSYQPTAVELASLDCSFSAMGEGANVGAAYCSKNEVYLPPNVQAYVNGATFYMNSIPDETIDEYRFTFARRDTLNRMIMHVDIDVKACENVSQIPDTGVSLRSPLKSKVTKDQTNFVFTGNSLRIPAIGLGMEYPIPIVHVYYEDGQSSDKGWDLSTLGNYVGELEGGTYIPYGGNSALTGHNWSGGVFKNLGNLNPEDEIIIFANDGIKYTYAVTEKFYTKPTDVYAMFQQIGERSLTLVTCDNYNFVTDEYDRRTLVRATLVAQAPYDTP